MNKRYNIAKNTSRIINAVLPEHLKMARGDSNFYKTINAIMGIENDLFRTHYEESLNNMFLDTADLTIDFDVSELTHSGILTTQKVYGDGSIIKMVDEYAFYNGEPTRIEYVRVSGFPDITSIVGLEYFDTETSGYYIVNDDKLQSTARTNNDYTTYKYDVDSDGNIIDSSGYNPGVTVSNFETNGVDEIVVPQTREDLLDKYPITRRTQVFDDDGIAKTVYVDHYEPDPDVVVNYDGEYVADTSKFNADFYYGADGEKIWFRSMLNNPNGSGVYDSSFVVLANTPISGTVNVYDIDNLDPSGNPIRIYRTGTPVYELTDINYEGYTVNPPSEPEQVATLKHIVNWDYVPQSGSIDEETFQFNTPDGAPISNRLKFTNGTSRYLVEYEYYEYTKSKAVTAYESNRYVRKDTDNILYSFSENIDEVDVPFSFSETPGDNKEHIVMNGLLYRPGSKLSRIEVKAPLVLSNQEVLKRSNTANLDARPIGASTEYIPNVSKDWQLNINFDNTISNNQTSELDQSTNEYVLNFKNDSATVTHDVYNKYIGKRINYSIGDTYFYVYNRPFNNNLLNYKFGFKRIGSNDITFMESSDTAFGRYFKFYLNGTDDRLYIETDNKRYISKATLSKDHNESELILSNIIDGSTGDHTFKLYYGTPTDLFTRIDLSEIQQNSTVDIIDHYGRFFVNSTVVVGKIEIWETKV